jgi:hypothetical protein
MVTKEHKESKPTVWQRSPNNLNFNNFEMIEAMGLEIIALRSP